MFKCFVYQPSVRDDAIIVHLHCGVFDVINVNLKLFRSLVNKIIRKPRKEVQLVYLPRAYVSWK